MDEELEESLYDARSSIANEISTSIERDASPVINDSDEPGERAELDR
jgi:hypothetical protein